MTVLNLDVRFTPESGIPRWGLIATNEYTSKISDNFLNAPFGDRRW